MATKYTLQIWIGTVLFCTAISITEQISRSTRIDVPTRLEVHRTSTTITIRADKQALQSIPLTFDPTMTTGTMAEWQIYPAGVSRPTQPGSIQLNGGTDFAKMGDYIVNPGDRDFPIPGKQFVVEIDLTVFETPVRPQHMWYAKMGSNYRVLWHRVIRQVIN